MSLTAAAELLTDGRLQRRFCDDSAMRAYLGLLQERIPVGGTVLKNPGTDREKPPQPPARGAWEASGEGTDFRQPVCCLLAGESYTLLAAETGLTRARWGQIAPYVSPFSPLDREKGVEVFLDLGEHSVPLLPDASADCTASVSWRFATDRAEFFTADGALRASCAVALAEDDAGERRSVELTNCGNAPLQAELVLRFRPLLAREADRRSHPAFWAPSGAARTPSKSQGRGRQSSPRR